jgi:hypothetical protein
MNNDLTMTLAEIRYHQPCEDGWRTLLASVGGARAPLTTRVSLGDIARCSSAAEAWWSVRALDWSDDTVRRRVVSVLLLTVRRAAMHTTDDRVHASIEAIQRWCDGDDSVDLRAAADAAAAAAKARAADAAAAWAAARAAARAAALVTREVAWATREAEWAANAAADAAGAEVEIEQQRSDLIAAFPPLHGEPV